MAVSYWEEGGYDYASVTLSEVYGKGYFHYGIEIEGIGLVIQDLNVEVKILMWRSKPHVMKMEITRLTGVQLDYFLKNNCL